MRFDGKTVVLTGVGREGQVGEAVAHAFGSAGATLIAVDRSEELVLKRAATLRSAGFSARTFACDLSDEGPVRALAARVRDVSEGRIHALVHMAGGFGTSGPVADSTLEVWQHQMSINLMTAFLTTRAFLPLLRPARGAIVYFSSASALPGARVASVSAYAIAKVGVATLMRAVAEEERTNGVRANALAPSTIRTAENVRAGGDSARYIEREDVARAAMFLCSDDAAAITGQLIGLG